MALNTQQTAWLADTRREYQKLALAVEKLEALRAMYTDRGYGSGGAAEIINSDLIDENSDLSGVTPSASAEKITSGMTAIDQLLNYRDNAAVTTGDYGATISTMRAL